MRRLAILCAFALSISLPSAVAKERSAVQEAIRLYERGQVEACRALLDPMCGPDASDEIAQGYYVMCMERLLTPGYEASVEKYLVRFPYSTLITPIRFLYAGNFFNDGRYADALVQMENLDSTLLDKDQLKEYTFKKAYCNFTCGNTDAARDGMEVVSSTKGSPYVTSARFFLGYMAYTRKDYVSAQSWFSSSVKDPRFEALSNYYIIECRYYAKDYEYVSQKGPAALESGLTEQHKKRLARLVADSFMILDDPDSAKEIYDEELASVKAESNKDRFFLGSMYYGVEDYQAAAAQFQAMTDRSDSLGQIANYQLAHSLFNCHNKVAALDAFRDAALVDFDPEITKDAYLNYAKLSFDLNSNASVYKDYMKRYPDPDESDRIYSYIAVAALRNKDYSGALDAFDEIEELDETMSCNYMKANFLQAMNLIAGGAYRDAVERLKMAIYFGPEENDMEELMTYYMADAQYRSGDYGNSLKTYQSLYNHSALMGTREEGLIMFGMAYSHYKLENYPMAVRWFGKFLATGPKLYAREAQVCIADCQFLQNQYSDAAKSYITVAQQYPLKMDAYPYYQAGLCYRLAGNPKAAADIMESAGELSPKARYYDETLLELGRSYAALKRFSDSRTCFNKLVERQTNATFAATALVELGSVERTVGNTGKALEYFKKVVSDYPNSAQTEDALAAIESLYKSQNNPRAYLAYLDEQGLSGTKSDTQRESMIFDAAEQIYLSGNPDAAIKALNDYFHDYPEPMFAEKGWYYLGEVYRKIGNSETALSCYDKVTSGGDGPYVELALKNHADISYGMQRYGAAFESYGKLRLNTRFAENRRHALKGMVRSAFDGRMYEKVISTAPMLESDSACTVEDKREASLLKGKSYMFVGDRESALAEFAALAGKPSDVFGAEASYIIIKDCFDRGDFAAVQEKTFTFSEKGPDQQIWLARAFILLGDSYVATDRRAQAKATYESIRDGYSPSGEDDDILEIVNARLGQLSKK